VPVGGFKPVAGLPCASPPQVCRRPYAGGVGQMAGTISPYGWAGTHRAL